MGSLSPLTAIVLAHTDVGEADRIVTLLSREEGLVRAAASGARDLAKGQPAALDLFVLSRFWVHRSKSAGKLPRLRGAELVDAHLGIRSDYGKVCAASYMAEILARTIQEGQESPEAFDLCCWCLSEIEAAEPIPRVLAVFIVRLLGSMGMAPELDRCVRCRKEALGKVRMVPGEGGAVCEECGGTQRGEPLSPGDLATIRFLGRKPLEFLDKLQASTEAWERLFNAMHAFGRHHLGFEPRATSLLQKC